MLFLFIFTNSRQQFSLYDHICLKKDSGSRFSYLFIASVNEARFLVLSAAQQGAITNLGYIPDSQAPIDDQYLL